MTAAVKRKTDVNSEYLAERARRIRQLTADWVKNTIALGKEFLRQGSRLDMPAPRAVLALTAAAHHLRRAADLVDGIDYAGRERSGI